MKPLYLVLTEKWYDMIESGEKKEEYRDFSMYWLRRLVDNSFYDQIASCVVGNRPVPFKPYKEVIFQLAYPKNPPRMTFKIKCIRIGHPQPGWCPKEAEGHDKFIIELGERI